MKSKLLLLLLAGPLTSYAMEHKETTKPGWRACFKTLSLLIRSMVGTECLADSIPNMRVFVNQVESMSEDDCDMMAKNIVFSLRIESAVKILSFFEQLQDTSDKSGECNEVYRKNLEKICTTIKETLSAKLDELGLKIDMQPESFSIIPR